MLLAVASIVILALGVTFCIKKCTEKRQTEVELDQKNSDLNVLARLSTLNMNSQKYIAESRKMTQEEMADEMNRSESQQESEEVVEVQTAAAPDFKVVTM